MARKKGDKDYSKSEKQLLIFLINDYSLFEATDIEIIQMLFQKIVQKISETLFCRLKNLKQSEANKNSGLTIMIGIDLQNFIEKKMNIEIANFISMIHF